jgi:hypothetical protein
MSDDEKFLLQKTTEDLVKEMRNPDNSQLSHVKQYAYEMWDSDSGQTWQVQITVTRDEADFLGFLQIECMS